jgi:hypothetical protein
MIVVIKYDERLLNEVQALNLLSKYLSVGKLTCNDIRFRIYTRDVGQYYIVKDDEGISFDEAQVRLRRG